MAVRAAGVVAVLVVGVEAVQVEGVAAAIVCQEGGLKIGLRQIRMGDGC